MNAKVGSLNVDLTLETARFEQGVARSQAATRRLESNLQAITKTSGSMRSGMQQLGFQLNDVATQFASGTKASVIFAQQGGQVIQAIQMMSGGTSRFASFMGGPWGIALTAGTVALSPFIARLFDTRDAADSARGALENLIKRRQQEKDRVLAPIRTQEEISNLRKEQGVLERRKQFGSRGLNTGEMQRLEKVRSDIAEGEAALAWDAEQRKPTKVTPTPVIRGGGGRGGLSNVRVPRMDTSESALTSLMNRLFPDDVAFKKYRDELALVEKAELDGKLSAEAALGARQRLQEEFRGTIDLLKDLPIESDSSELRSAVDRASESLDVFGKNSEDMRDRVTRSVKEMSEDTIAALGNLASSIKDGGFLDIFSSVVDLALQLGSVGAFGKKFQTSLSRMNAYAAGTFSAASGLALVGERGPELVKFGGGERVFNHNDTRDMLGRQPINFDLRGAVMTADLLNQMQRMANAAGSAGAMSGAAMAEHRMTKRAQRRLA